MHEDISPQSDGERWYDLFSRGARDWLRHNDKVREAVREALPDLVTGPDVLTRPGNRTVQIPVRFLEHHRFRLAAPDEHSGAGQGQAKPGDILRRGNAKRGAGTGQGGDADGGYQFVLELCIDDILDWLWEELQLPNLQPKEGRSIQQEELVREGWDKRGARSRLDRRRTLREAVKRRSVQGRNAVPFSNEDLRFRQLARRRQPTTMAVVFFLLDVSSSMDEHCRRLAKTFFFWALQGIRRQFQSIETIFVAHTVQAWEFDERDFFQVSGAGGTKASSGFDRVQSILLERFDPSRYNSYLFYASDGENFTEDREPASQHLRELAETMNFIGYAEVSHRLQNRLRTETANLVKELPQGGGRAVAYSISRQEDIWPAIRAFFVDQVGEVSISGG